MLGEICLIILKCNKGSFLTHSVYITVTVLTIYYSTVVTRFGILALRVK